MTTARLTYDSNNIDFVNGVHEFNAVPIQVFAQSIALSGVPEQINEHGYHEITLSIFHDEDIFNSVTTFWWSWARDGGEFSFALNSSQTSDTTLDGGVSGATIPLTATTGLTVGDTCVVIADGDNERENIVIDTINAGVSVVAESNLINSFVSGDVFRHAYYFSTLMNMDKQYRYTYHGGGFYTSHFKWVEVLS